MTEAQTLAYVKAAAVAAGLSLEDERAARVAMHLHRTASMAALLDAAPLEPHDEIAEMFRPAPFVHPEPR